MSLILNIKERDLTKKFPKPHKIESQTKSLKGVLYGKKEKTIAVEVPYIPFKKVLRDAGGSSLVVLKGVGEDKEVIIQDVVIDPVSERICHVDFYVVERGKVMEVDIKLEFIGESPAVKELGGMLVKTLRELKIEVLPKDLPKVITVDLSILETLESKILVKDLILSGSAMALDDPEEVVVLVTEAKEEKEEEIEKPNIEDIEIEEKGKKEDSNEDISEV